jgi:hypothetical protein
MLADVKISLRLCTIPAVFGRLDVYVEVLERLISV